jgi:hypothetical protein
MSLVYRFRRLVFIQVLLGIVAFCMAEPGGNPGLMLIAGTVCALSWYVVEGPTGKPMPQWTINLAALAAVLWLGVDMYIQKGNVIIAMGHFTMWLQILQLYGKKSNREYGLILVLSLLQMVGASILSVSMIFGMLLGAYCLLSLFTVLLFQFKSTSDDVLEANEAAACKPAEARRPNPVVSRGHRWQFRLMALFIGAVCGGAALVIFILIPRTSRMSEINIPSPLARAQTGFSNRVQLGGAPPGEGSREPVLNMKISQSQPFFLLRGAALDVYNRRSHTWVRGSEIKALDKTLPAGEIRDPEDDMRNPRKIILTRPVPTTGLAEAEITLRAGRHGTLFTIYPTVSLECQAVSSLTANPHDQQVTGDNNVTSVLLYRLHYVANHQTRLRREDTPTRSDYRPWRFGEGRPPRGGEGPFRPRPDRPAAPAGEDDAAPDYARGWNVERELIRGYALQVLRTVYKDPTLDRDYDQPTDPRDYAFAQALESHLQSAFTYSTTNIPRGERDPIVEFLTTDRQGHCELFASALAAMTRSLGMRARVITGYRAGEYNSIGGYFIVRERNAHAWTEIDCGGRGWQVFDGTPPADVAREHAVDRSFFASVRDLYEHLEFMWLDTFVTYDKETRAEMLGGIGDSIRATTGDRESLIGGIIAWFAELPELWKNNQVSFLLMVMIVVFIVVGVASLVRTVMVRRRRLAALQLTRLPRTERRTLARRLTFYLLMLDMLERHGQVRPAWQSPFKFATDLAAAAPMRYAPVVALTEEFYEIRFGHRDLDDTRQQKIRALLKQLEQTLINRPVERV